MTNAQIDKSAAEFVKQYGVACGGDWTQMLMQAIKNGFPKVYAEMTDQAYTFGELWDIIKMNIQKGQVA